MSKRGSCDERALAREARSLRAWDVGRGPHGVRARDGGSKGAPTRKSGAGAQVGGPYWSTSTVNSSRAKPPGRTVPWLLVMLLDVAVAVLVPGNRVSGQAVPQEVIEV